MIIIQTLSDKVALFDKTGLFLFNQKDPKRKDRILFALFMMIFAIIGILLQPSSKVNFFICLWTILFGVWVVYFIRQIIVNNYPEKLTYSEIDKLTVLYRKKHYEIIIYYSQNNKPIVLLSNTIDENMFIFLEEKLVKLEKLNF